MSDTTPRILCAGCGLLMADYGHGHKRCARCTYGADWGRSSKGAGERARQVDGEKRPRLKVVRSGNAA